MNLSNSQDETSQSPLAEGDTETRTFRRKNTSAVRRLFYLIGPAFLLWALIMFLKQFSKQRHSTSSSLSEPKQITSLRGDKDRGPLVPVPPGPVHDWTKMETWLCPGHVPNLTAAITTFRLAQQVFLKRNESLTASSAVPTFPFDRHINDYFSFWPGHLSLRNRETNKTAAFVSTYKCGSETVIEYFTQQLAPLGHVEVRQRWEKFLELGGQDYDCLVTSFRDPMDHFFSGLGELEMRTIKEGKEGKRPDHLLASYERLPVLSEDRLVRFVEFLLFGEWFERNRSGKQVPYHFWDLSHVSPQSGYLAVLHSINRTITAYTPLANLSSTLPTLLEENCGIPKGLPPVKVSKLHDKVPGLSDVYKKFWADGSATALSATSRLPVIHALCLFHAVDYACLAPLLKVPPPEVCAEAFVKYLPV